MWIGRCLSCTRMGCRLRACSCCRPLYFHPDVILAQPLYWIWWYRRRILVTLVLVDDPLARRMTIVYISAFSLFPIPSSLPSASPLLPSRYLFPTLSSPSPSPHTSSPSLRSDRPKNASRSSKSSKLAKSSPTSCTACRMIDDPS